MRSTGSGFRLKLRGVCCYPQHLPDLLSIYAQPPGVSPLAARPDFLSGQVHHNRLW
jgi:hypothetical protein